MNTAAEAWQVFTDHPVILLLMPVVGAFIGWITKVLAIWMVFKPIKFVGIGPIGWQGQLPDGRPSSAAWSRTSCSLS